MNRSPKRPYSLSTAHGTLRIWGGDGDEDEKRQGSGQPDDSGKPGAGDDDKSVEESAEQKRIKELEQERDDYKKKHKDEKKRADDAESARQEKEREGMEDAQRTEAERDDYKAKYEKLLKVVETSVIDTAITNLSNAKDKNGKAKYDWHDVQAVRAFLDKDDVHVDLDTGEVSGLENQLKDIATKRPYLLVPQQEQQQQPPGGPATGSHPVGGQARQQETDRTKLGAKYKIPGFVGVGNPRPM